MYAGLTRWLTARMVRRHRTVISTRHGMFWIDPRSLHGRQIASGVEAEPDIADALRRFLSHGSVFVDVGANEGYFTVQAASYCGERGQVYAVEPQTRSRIVLERNCRLNDCANVRILPVAVADYEGTLRLHLHPATNTGATSVVRPSRSAWQSVRVPCVRLEQLLDAAAVGAVDLLKMDIEGAEHEAILGSQALFRTGRIRALALEYHPAILARRGLRRSDIHDFLLTAGYVPDAPQPPGSPDTEPTRVVYVWP